MDRAAFFSLLLVNGILLTVALAADWGWHPLLVVYWLECVIVGAFNVLKMFVVAVAGNPFGRWGEFENAFSAIFFVIVIVGFFLAKFGGVIFGIGLFVMSLPAIFDESGEFRVVMRSLESHGPSIALAVGLLVVSHAVSFVRNFLLHKEYERLGLLGLLFIPYLRLIWLLVTTLVVLAVVAAQPLLAPTIAFPILLVVVKLLADVFGHWREHRRGTRASHNLHGT